MCMCAMLVHMQVYLGLKPGVPFGYIPQSLSTLLFEAVSLTEPGAHRFS